MHRKKKENTGKKPHVLEKTIYGPFQTFKNSFPHKVDNNVIFNSSKCKNSSSIYTQICKFYYYLKMFKPIVLSMRAKSERHTCNLPFHLLPM